MRSVPPAVVHALDLVLAKVLAKLPVDRYPTCQALTSAYYNALRVDTHKEARYQSRDKQPALRNLNETIISDQPSRPVSPTPVPVALDATIIDPPSTPPVPVSPTPVLDLTDATVIAPPAIQHKRIPLKPPRLLIITEPGKDFRATFDLKGETITLGRAKDNDLSLPLLIISRHYAVLKRLHSDLQEPSYKIVQLKSINPLLFKGNKVSEKVLEHGDTFEIGVRGDAKYIVKLTYLAAEYDSGDSL